LLPGEERVTDIRASHKALVTRLLEGDAKVSRALRRAAFDDAELPELQRALVDKVAKGAHTVSDEDFDALRKSGVSEDEIFEIVVCAAVGQATRQYDSGRAALAAARKE
jgi:alkylhydroperoxidase family enzyme